MARQRRVCVLQRTCLRSDWNAEGGAEAAQLPFEAFLGGVVDAGAAGEDVFFCPDGDGAEEGGDLVRAGCERGWEGEEEGEACAGGDGPAGGEEDLEEPVGGPVGGGGLEGAEEGLGLCGGEDGVLEDGGVVRFEQVGG